MRCDQMVGRTAAADAFLEAKQIVNVNVCPTCGHRTDLSKKPEVIGRFYGMFDQEYPLHRFQLQDDCYAEEYLQAEPWSSGPMFFIGLRVYDAGNRLIQTFEWTEEEIDGNV